MPDDTAKRLDASIREAAEKFPTLQCEIHAPSIGLDYRFSSTKPEQAFLSALRGGRIVSPESLAAMSSFGNTYRTGMEYALGMMRLRFGQFFFLLRGLPRLQGHLEVLGVHAWYHPTDGDSYVLNTGSADDIASSFITLIKVVQLVERAKRKRR